MGKENNKASRETKFDQSAVIPYRLKDGLLEILLITSIRKKNWIVPKGFIESHLSPYDSAKKEAYEEAGVRGGTDTIALGSYKRKKYGGELLIQIFSMKVARQEKQYPEKYLRKRKWFPLNKAVEKTDNPEIAKMIRKLGRLSKQNKL